MVALLGENGTGKTTLISALAGKQDLVSFADVAEGAKVTMTPSGCTSGRYCGVVVKKQRGRAVVRWCDPAEGGPPAHLNIPRERVEPREWWDAGAGAVTVACGGALPPLCVSVKPQHLSPKWKGNVKDLLGEKVPAALGNAQFRSDVVEPLRVGALMDKQVLQLSGGELQRVALVLALGKPAQLYLIDEPSAGLDVDMRLTAAQVLRRHVRHSSACCMLVEHDLLFAAYAADRAIVFSGEPAGACAASLPLPLAEGMNRFLAALGVTMRIDAESGRPRVNKPGGQADREQKKAGEHFAAASGRGHRKVGGCEDGAAPGRAARADAPLRDGVLCPAGHPLAKKETSNNTWRCSGCNDQMLEKEIVYNCDHCPKGYALCTRCAAAGAAQRA